MTDLPPWGADLGPDAEPFTIIYPTPEQAMRRGQAAMHASAADETDTDEEGPWGIFDGYCLKCSARAIHVAPVAAEDVPLWECGTCGAMAVQYHVREDGDE